MCVSVYIYGCVYIYIYIYVCVCVCVFTNPSTSAGYDARSIFKWSLTGLNSEFSFFKTNCVTRVKEPSLPYYFNMCLLIYNISTFKKFFVGLLINFFKFSFCRKQCKSVYIIFKYITVFLPFIYG